MEHTTKRFVLYNNENGKFRSSKTNRHGYGSINSAIIYKTNRGAKSAASKKDIPVEITISVKEEDIFNAVLTTDIH